MKALRFDCINGVSGDMLVGSLLDLGVDANELNNVLKELSIGNYSLNIKRINKKGTMAIDFDVILKDDNYDHDMSFLYSNESKTYKIESKRNIDDVIDIVNKNKYLSEKTKNLAIRIFDIVATAEAKAHGIKKDEIVFHETGAMDSIIDIVSFAFCIDRLNIDKVYAYNLREGRGMINTRIGKLPIPTPAIKNMIERFNLTIAEDDLPYELITPTGLASLCATVEFGFELVEVKVIKTGYGAGKRKYNLPCVLKAELIDIK